MIVEKNTYVGGFASRQKFDSGYFDVGGHAFPATDDEVNAELRQILGDDLYEITFKHKIMVNGKIIGFPPNIFEFLGLFKLKAFRVAFELCKSRFCDKSKIGNSVEFFRKCLSNTFYQIYLKDMVEKNTGDLAKIHVSWVRDRFIPPSEKHFYCKYGYGFMFEKLAGEIVKKGGRILLSTDVRKINVEGNRVMSIEVAGEGGLKETLRAFDEVYSSIPIDNLVNVISNMEELYLSLAEEIRYTDLIICIIELNDTKRRIGDNWLWIKDRDMLIGRCFESAMLSTNMSKNNYIEAEIFCPPSRRDIWNMSDQEIKVRVRQDISTIKLVKDNDISKIHIARFRRPYPYFDLLYKQRMRTIAERLGRIENIHLIGRYGTFSYLNTLQAMKSYENPGLCL